MADSVTKWKSGQNPVPGTESVGYPYCDFTWNDPDTNSHAAVTSEAIAYPGRYFSFALNTDAAAVGGSANLAFTVLGSNSSSLTEAKWTTVSSGTVLSAAITEKMSIAKISAETTGSAAGNGVYKFYKLQLDPSADPGEVTIRVGLNAPPIGSDA
tara:strand:+ start:1787 stop:2251 length:465 start_codon:yes stop_codon:yes gene_type:complete